MSAPHGASIAPNAKATSRPRPYKDFLTPALHRSFTNAALIGLALCWSEAILMSKPSLFWSWFPFGWTGLRTGLLFISCLTIFILRVAFSHPGTTTDRSAAETVWRVFVSRRAIWTIIWYWTSGFLFSEIYIFSTAESANLAWIDPGRSYERMRLNERAVMLRTMFALLAVEQAALHLSWDYDALDIPRMSTKHYATSQPTAQTIGVAQLQGHAVRILRSALVNTFVTSVWGTAIYYLLLRHAAWSVAYSIGKFFFKLHKSGSPSGLADPLSLFSRFLFSGTLLVILWQTTNLAFTIYALQEPLKKGAPLTNDSRDPNASLVNGLKSKRSIPHSIALWELSLIAERLDDRRKTIYSDFEKPGSTTWVDIVSTCLAEIQGVSKSVQDAQTALLPPTQPAPAPAVESKTRISQPLKDDPNIFNASPKPNTAAQKMAVGVGAVAKSLGQTPGSSPLTNKAKSFVASETQSDNSAYHGFTRTIQTYAMNFLRTPFGSPFRVIFPARINAIVFGHPHSRASNIHNATQALCKLTTASLKEDNYGQVQHDIAKIMKALMGAIQDIQTLVQSYPPHWTDVEFKERRAPEVQELLVTLKDGLEGIIMTFGEYVDALGITRSDLRRAKELVGKGQEMVSR
ncbi:Nucleoporin NDC1-like protein [Elsinoe fawcettii]|nr:Nucleoporin NDC1-like protein [Elsinoe fawcettii]